MAETKTVCGLLAEYDSARDVYHACESIRDAGYTKWDAHTPFPVHGLEKAMGLKASVLPWYVLCAGIIGGLSAISFQIWVAAVDYPLNIGGKPMLSIPAFIPVTFEFTILLSGLTAIFGMLWLNRLPRFHNPLFSSARFERVTDDKFFVAIACEDPKFDAKKTRELLQSTHASAVDVIEELP